MGLGLVPAWAAVTWTGSRRGWRPRTSQSRTRPLTVWVGKLRLGLCVSQGEALCHVALASNCSLRMRSLPAPAAVSGLLMEVFGACFIFTF